MRTYVPVNYPIPPAQLHEGPPNPQPPPPPSLPSPISIPPKALRQTQSSRAPFYPFFPRAHYIKRHKMNVLVLSFAVSDTSSYPPPPHPDAFPLTTSKRQHASYNNNSLSQQTRKTKNSHTNQPASQRQAKVSSEQRMHAKTTTTPPPPAKKPNADPQPTDYIPRLKKTRTTSWCCLRPPIPSTSHQPRSPENIFLRPQTPLSTRDNLVIMALEVLSE